jgi:hypothetical protein
MTTWSYEGFSARDNVDTERGFDVRVRVRNTGADEGQDVVRVYLSGDEVGRAEVRAEPGEAVWVRVPIEPNGTVWSAEAGAITLQAGPSPTDLPLAARLNVQR